MEPSTVIRRNPRVAFQELAEGGGVLLHLDTAQYHGVNGMGALVWDLLGDGVTLDALLLQLRDRLDDAPPELGGDIAEFLEGLQERDLVAFSSGDQSAGTNPGPDRDVARDDTARPERG